ncbi:sulfotransferase [Streptomyces mirabilis]|uniref:sulfotransferase n=1 Tax=Streptomyces mirabilis TaxID=68239 RepID=UPI0031BB17B0
MFVLGCPRSGTTLVQLMLHARPRIALPPVTLPHGLKGSSGSRTHARRSSVRRPNTASLTRI